MQSLVVQCWRGPVHILGSVFDISIGRIKRNKQSIRRQKRLKEASDTKEG